MFAASKTGAPASPPVYVEDVFSTYLYTGNGSTQTITNGIDLAGKGGLVWMKDRSRVTNHTLYDTVRGVNKVLYSDVTSAQDTTTASLTAFNSNGFSVSATGGYTNINGDLFASWTFREQAKFFDVVTYTGNGANNRQISHNLGSAPGCIILKRTDGTGEWWTYHRSLGDVGGFSYDLQLNTTSNRTAYQIFGTGATQTSTYFTLGTVFAAEMNGNGANYVAYLFAHDAGGFGLTGTDNVISCGSYTGTGAANNQINLGYEPQWVLIKNITTNTLDWIMGDTMRGMPIGGNFQRLQANLSSAEDSVAVAGWVSCYAQGIQINGTGGSVNATGDTYIYIAIRRGPMKTPTTGTSVFNPTATTATTGTVINAGFPVDAQIIQYRTPAGGNVLWQDRLRGVNTNTTENNNPTLTSNNSSAESSTFSTTRYWDNNGYQISASLTGQNRIYWNFRRAPGFFDEVCVTGTGAGATYNHNLSVVPEFMIQHGRSLATDWETFTPLGVNIGGPWLNKTDAASASSGYWTAPTSTTFKLQSSIDVAGNTYVAYLFATCPGVSKVGSYTGTGALQTINCGFAAGARFVLIKRTDSTGAWYVWDSARGISSGNDPYLLINSTAAEVTSTNYVDTTAVGFQVTAAAPGEINANGGTFIFLAIA